jgi:hypothetical protein
MIFLSRIRITLSEKCYSYSSFWTKLKHQPNPLSPNRQTRLKKKKKKKKTCTRKAPSSCGMFGHFGAVSGDLLVFRQVSAPFSADLLVCLAIFGSLCRLSMATLCNVLLWLGGCYKLTLALQPSFSADLLSLCVSKFFF